MEGALAIVGIGLESLAWWRVSTGASVWAWLTPSLAAMGAAALLAGPPPFSPEVEPALALAVGAAAGLALYLATRLFFKLVADRWAALRRHSEAMYRRQGGLSLGIALVLSVAVSVPGEELFWRRFVQLELVDALEGATALAAAIAWVVFVFANAWSRNLAIISGAVVGGAVWCALAWWTGGVAASLACHVVWTALMLLAPVVRATPQVAR
jgi:membrane protease YdiL (CAAX protease family)